MGSKARAWIGGLLALMTLVVVAPQEAEAIGLLIPKDTKFRPFDIESHRVEVTITNNAAVTKVTQVFKNYSDRPLEGEFVFPVPKGATVSKFSLWINGKKTPGAVLEKKEARRIYESIVRRTEDPGLIEYMDGKLFRASIFPIPAKGTQKLELKFAQVLQKRGGLYNYNYPIAAGSDYVTAKTAKDFSLVARVKNSIPITAVYSPTHKIDKIRKGKGEVIVGTEEMQKTLDSDFRLFLGYSKKTIGLSLMTHDPDGEGGDPGYFMMALAPRVDVAAHEEIGQTFTFVLDTSGSMAGDKMKQARKTLEFCLSRLRPQDHFNVVRFSTDVEALFKNPVKATKVTKHQGLTFAKELQAAGGTAISSALERALKQTIQKDQPHQVIFITDGEPTIGVTDPGQILNLARAKLNKKSRLFTFGVGYEVNTMLLDGLAAHGRGRSDYVKPNENLEEAVGTLYTRISSPVLTDVEIDFGSAKVYDVYPNPLPDLFHGDQIVLFGRYRTAFGKPVTVKGTAGPEVKEFVFGKSKKNIKRKAKAPSVEYLEPLEFLPKLWATRKVGYMLDEIRRNGEKKELKDEVIRLAKKFGLVTPYTSYLAVDDSEFDNRRPVREPRRRPEPTDLDDLAGAEGSKSAGDGRTTTRRRTRRRVRRNRGRVASKPKKKDSKDRRKGIFGGFGGAGRGSAGPSAPSAAEEAEAPTFDGFDASSGEDSVAASESTREYKERDRVKNEKQNTRRFVSGRTFAWSGNTWMQQGLSAKSMKRAKNIEAYSTAYFKLLRKHPELKRISAQLGVVVVVKLGKRVYRIKRPKK